MDTIYSGYTDEELYDLFRSENWHSDKMTDLQREQALQELSDRAAQANGTRQCPVEVTGQTDPYGVYQRNTGKIGMNDEFTHKGTNCLDENHSPIPAANLRAMDTIYHENDHVLQHEMVEREPREGEDLQYRQDLTANFHGFNYIQPGYDYDLYRIQICEKHANEAGYARTMAAMEATNKQHDGKADPNMSRYAGACERSYQNSLAVARLRYDDPRVEETLQRAMNDNAFRSRAISENMTSSYYDIRALMAQQEVDAYRPYIAEHPDLEKDRLEGFTQVIQERTDEMDALSKAWEESEANPDNHPSEVSEPAAPSGAGEDDGIGSVIDDSDDNGDSDGMSM